MNKKAEVEYPAPFALKVMGRNEEDFVPFVLEIFGRHVAEIDASAVTSRLSRDSNYLSVNVPFLAQSRAQLEALYKELNSNPRILMVV